MKSQMKKYVSRETKWLTAATLICFTILTAGVVLILSDSKNISLQIGLIVSGGFMGALFFICFLAERSRALILDPEKIVFPRGASVNGKTVMHKSIVRFDEIRSMSIKFYKGDKIITKDTAFYTLTLKDSTTITVTLFAYGKGAEKEISETIRQHIA